MKFCWFVFLSEKEQQLRLGVDPFAKKKKDEKAHVRFNQPSDKAEDYIISKFLEIDVEKKVDPISLSSDESK